MSYLFPKRFLDLAGDLKKLFYKPEPETVVPGQIITINKFFSPELCQELISSFEKGINLETTPLRKLKEYAVRVNDRWSTTDYESSQKLWQYLKQLLIQENEYGYEDPETAAIKRDFEQAIGLNPQLRVYRYRKGHHFGQHYDESVSCAMDAKGKSKGQTHWTLLIYLTGDEEFVGGGTIFYPDIRGIEPLNIHPTKGMALLHKHGDDCLRHEGELVKDGVKWVLRSDVVFPR